MANIDRTQKEKVINIFGRKVKYGTICVIGLLIILSFSSLAYLESYLTTRANQPKDSEEQKMQVSLIVIFSQNSSVTKQQDIEPNANALFAFKKIANITTVDTPAGKSVYSVGIGNKSMANNQTHSWIFFVNGGLYLKGPDQYIVKDRDNLMLQFSRNFE